MSARYADGMTTNRMVRLASRPVGLVDPSNFDFVDAPAPEPNAGEFRVHVEVISLDPAMRGWMNEGHSYVPPVDLGAVMRAYGAGRVDASNHPDFPVGTAVAGLFGVQRYAVSDGKGVAKIDLDAAPVERWVGGLGMPGRTAYFGLLDLGRPKAGETVVVSAASGAVGQIVGQIAKLQGARAVGIAGGPDKCSFLTEELGFDAAVDYKREDFVDQLKAATPNRIDVYFENVGGPVGDACFRRMNRFGRVPVCGLIHHYNATEDLGGLSVPALRSILVNRLEVRGFIVFDFAARGDEATAQLGAWHRDGQLKMREDVRDDGIDAYPAVLNELFSGGNFGKLVLRL